MDRILSREMFKTCNNMRRSIINSKLHSQTEHSVSGNNGVIIGFIAELSAQKKPVFQKDVEREFNLRSSTVSKVLRLMEQKGFIERQSVSGDARLRQIVLTEQSKKIAQELLIDRKQLEKTITNGIEEQELCVFFDVLDKINRNLMEEDKV